MHDFKYISPETTEGVCHVLREHGDGTMILSGGQSLMPALRAGAASPECIVDINGLDDKSYVRREGEEVRIGCLARHSDVAESEVLKSANPVVPETAEQIGDRQVRNRGTFCGSVAHADLAGDPPVLVSLLDATIVAANVDGTSTYDGDSFYHGFYETELDKSELITEVRIPVQEDSQGAGYEKWEPSEGAYPVATVGAYVELDGGTVTDAKVVTGAIEGGPNPVAEAADVLIDELPTIDVVDQVAEVTGDQSEPIEDSEGSVEFKQHLTKSLTKRSLTDAIERAGGVL